MEKNQKLFAFRLADQAHAQNNSGRENEESKWRIRDGVSIAGCSDSTGDGGYRCTSWGYDNGHWC